METADHQNAPAWLSDDQCQELLGHWNSARLHSVTEPQAGTINTLRIAATDQGQFVLRLYRHHDRSRLEREHRVVAWIAEQGLPAVVPLPTRTGATFAEWEGYFATLLPYIPHRQIARHRLQAAHIKAMGSFLGRLHRTLAQYPGTDIPPVRFTTDRRRTLAGIDHLEALIESLPHPQDLDRHALQRLRTRRLWLQNRPPEDTAELASLPFQAVHGDYQESNIFFNGTDVAAVIDWDKIYTAPPAWEVVRTLHLVLELQTTPSIAFVRAYRSQHPLSIGALETAARCYGLMRAYDLWLYEAIYQGGNQRLRAFVKRGDFAPLERDWTPLQEKIAALS
ncbi:MAG: phosphotransferase [Candidatus Latescibacteria bacterium]|nr:phosphotransferase [Candidatus Latescibacterota bacterium]